MVRSILAVLVASIITFVWGWLSWGVFGWHHPKEFKDQEAVAEVLKANVEEHGYYAYPSWHMNEDPEAWEEKWDAGPSIYAMVRPGVNARGGMSSSMARGFVINVIASVALLLLIQKGAHPNFADRVSIAVLAGLFLGIVSALYPWNWMEAPGLETLASLIDGLVPWTLAGCAMAAILPKKQAD